MLEIISKRTVKQLKQRSHYNTFGPFREHLVFQNLIKQGCSHELNLRTLKLLKIAITKHSVGSKRVICPQLLRPEEDSTSTQRYIDSRTVQPRAKGVWISVDVTETVKDWVSDPGLVLSQS